MSWKYYLNRCLLTSARKLALRGVGGARQGAPDADLPRVHRQPAGHGLQAHGGRRPHGLQQPGPVPTLLPPLPHEPQGGAGAAAVRARPAADHQIRANIRAGVQQRDLPGEFVMFVIRKLSALGDCVFSLFIGHVLKCRLFHSFLVKANLTCSYKHSKSNFRQVYKRVWHNILLYRDDPAMAKKQTCDISGTHSGHIVYKTWTSAQTQR